MRGVTECKGGARGCKGAHAGVHGDTSGCKGVQAGARVGVQGEGWPGGAPRGRQVPGRATAAASRATLGRSRARAACTVARSRARPPGGGARPRNRRLGPGLMGGRTASGHRARSGAAARPGSAECAQRSQRPGESAACGQGAGCGTAKMARCTRGATHASTASRGPSCWSAGLMMSVLSTWDSLTSTCRCSSADHEPASSTRRHGATTARAAGSAEAGGASATAVASLWRSAGKRVARPGGGSSGSHGWSHVCGGGSVRGT